MSTWSFTAKSNLRGSPQRRSSPLSLGDVADRHRLVRHVRHAAEEVLERRPAARRAAPRTARAAPSASRLCAAAAPRPGPCAFAWPMSLAIRLRVACACSTAVCRFLRVALEAAGTARRRSVPGPRVGEAPRHRLGILAQELDVDHLSLLASASRRAQLARCARASASRPRSVGSIPLDRRHAVGQVVLARRVGVLLVVRVAVALAVAEVLHELRRRVAQVQRHRPRAVLRDERARRIVGLVDRVRFRRQREVDHRLGQRELALRACPGARRSRRRRARCAGARGSARPMSSTAMRTMRRPM